MITATQAISSSLRIVARCRICRRSSEINLQALVDRGRGDDPIAQNFRCLGWSIEPGARPTDLCWSRDADLTVSALETGPKPQS